MNVALGMERQSAWDSSKARRWAGSGMSSSESVAGAARSAQASSQAVTRA
ncbi:MAG: hypothetical protein ACK4YP_26630 [Myxococcota bacterium]